MSTRQVGTQASVLPDAAALLDVADLRVSFRDEHGHWRETVRGVSFQVPPASTVALVGESGSGKSVSVLAAMGLLPARVSRIEPGSRLHFGGQNLLELSAAEQRALRGARIAMVFQEPMSSLNPVYRVGDQIAETLRMHRAMNRGDAMARARALLEEVGLPDPGRRLRAYPHELSGGQQQRVMIAMAIACEPELLIADEPTTALDVTVQRQILDLLAELRVRRKMALLFITHDLGVVADIAEHIVVMRDGIVREQGRADKVLGQPADAYTRALLACRPTLRGRSLRLLQVEDFLEPATLEPATLDPGTLEPAILDPGTLEPAILERAAAPPAALRNKTAEDNPPSAQAGVTGDPLPPLLVVRGLSRVFSFRSGLFRRESFTALKDVSFSLRRGETVGVVGESGCGKTTLGLTLMRLHEPTSGSVHFAGQDLARVDEAGWRSLRRRVQIVFQNPYASLNPRFTVAQILREPLLIHAIGTGQADREARCAAMLEQVGLPASALARYPHEFSGGQRQRIAIARCLVLEPDVLILDESVSALDVSVQAQVLNLLKDLQARLGMAYLFISHDLAVVRYMADRILVMHGGEVVEEARTQDLFDGGHHHPYTTRLLASIPGR